MSKIIGDEQCPKCAANGGDSTKNHLIRFADGGGYCNRCEYVETAGEPMTKIIIDSNKNWDSISEFYNIGTFPILELGTRGIKQDIAAHYGVRSSVDTATGEIDTHYYPITIKGEVVSYRLRGLPKSFSNVGKVSLKGLEVELFGQNVTPEGSKRLLICEGQDDALAASQMLHEKYPNYWPSVVAILGVANKQIADNLAYINTFEEVYLYLDQDTVGKEATESIAQLIGDKVRVVKTSLKDANAMLLEGKASEFVNSYFNAKPYAPEGFVTVEDVFQEATAMPEYGRPWPWPSMTKLTYGRRDGEGIYFGAGVKIGKSEAVNQIAHHVTQVEGGKIALFKLEEKPAMTVRKLAGKIKHKQFHKPDGDFTHEELIEGVKAVKGAVFYDSYAATSWDGLKAAIRHAVLVEGCKDVIIDPLTRLTVGMTSSEANEELERVADELSKLAKDLLFFYMIFCHLKAPSGDKKPHERGGKVLSNQFTGSRAMMRACYFMVGIERNKDPELEEMERNTSTFVLLEDRAFGNIGKFEVFYNKTTGDYLEPLVQNQEF